MATDGYRGFGVRHDSDAPFQRYQLKYQHAQQGPHGATQGHTKYHQKASIFDLHTPRTKAAGPSPTHVEPEMRAAGQAHEGQRRVTAILVTTALPAVKAAPAARRFAVQEP
jgi:hypothetical protein